jgi:hypothetical protein
MKSMNQTRGIPEWVGFENETQILVAFGIYEESMESVFFASQPGNLGKDGRQGYSQGITLYGIALVV